MNDKFGVIVLSQVLLIPFSAFYIYVCCKSPVQLNNGEQAASEMLLFLELPQVMCVPLYL